jgi:lysozyme
MVKRHYLAILISLIIAASATSSAQGDYSVSEDGLNFIAEHEGIRYNLYNDPAGHCTIGIGHLVHNGNCDGSDTSEQEFLGGITRDQAFELLRSDVAIAEQAVNTHVIVPLTQAQFDALVSFTYNLGAGNFQSSDLLKKLNAGQYDAVPQELNRWVYGGGKILPGLVTRRQDEGELFQSAGVPSSQLDVQISPEPSQEQSGISITGFKWIGMDADKIGEWDNGMPDGSMDGHFLLDLNLPVPTEIKSILIYSADASRNPVGGQFWHTAATNHWMLGVFNKGTQLNKNHVPSLGNFSGQVQFDLYADDSGWFKPGNMFGLEVSLGNLQRLIMIPLA